MNKKLIGYLMMVLGFGIVYAQIFILDKITEPLRSIIGLSIFFIIALPLVLGGSIISETAPDFVMKRAKARTIV